MTSTALADGAGGARSPRSHYDVILVTTSFATELATPRVTDLRTNVRTDTLVRLIYKDLLYIIIDLLLTRTSLLVCLILQEGQHPLTGQRTANFRLSFFDDGKTVHNET